MNVEQRVLLARVLRAFELQPKLWTRGELIRQRANGTSFCAYGAMGALHSGWPLRVDSLDLSWVDRDRLIRINDSSRSAKMAVRRLRRAFRVR